MAENKGILPSSTFNTLGNNSNKWEAVYANKLVGPLTGNAATATKATQDSAGQQINTTYIKGLSISNNALIYTKGNGTTGNVDLIPIPAGTVQMFAGNTIPAGWLLCDGSAISRTNYADLFAVIGTTYGAGDGSTTFNLPLLTDGRFIEGSNTPGTRHKAGLPNILGSTGICPVGRDWVLDNHGALYGANFVQGINAYGFAPGALWNNRNFGEAAIVVDASRSNPIYGSSTTVQPPALTMLPIIKY